MDKEEINPKNLLLIDLIKSLGKEEVQYLQRYLYFFQNIRQSSVIFIIDDTTNFIYSLIAAMLTKEYIFIVNSKEKETIIKHIVLNYFEDAVIVVDTSQIKTKLRDCNGVCPIKHLSLGSCSDIMISTSLCTFKKLFLFDNNDHTYIKSISFSIKDLNDKYQEITNGFDKYKLSKKNFHIISDNIGDYFLYFAICKILNPNYKINTITNKHLNDESKNNVLIVEYMRLMVLWKEILSNTLQNKLFFKLLFANKYTGCLILSLLSFKLKKLFKKYDNVVILGIVIDPLLTKILLRWSKIKLFNIYGEVKNLMYMNISDKIGYICTDTIDSVSFSLWNRISEKEGVIISKLSVKKWDNPFHTETSSVYFMQQLEDKQYARYYGYKFVSTDFFPYAIESLINIIPFIRTSVLVKKDGRNIIIYDPDDDILDSLRIGLVDLTRILRKRIIKINLRITQDKDKINEMRIMGDHLKIYNRFGLLDMETLYRVENQ